MKAILHNVIIRQHFKKEQKTNSGIFLPEKTKEKRPGKGEVISTGELVTVVKVGDKILHRRWEGVETPDPLDKNAEPLLVLKDTDLLAVLESYD